MLFIVANLGVSGSTVVLRLAVAARGAARGTRRVSSPDMHIGYLGGGLLLLINLAWILQPPPFGFLTRAAATKASFFSVGVWWCCVLDPSDAARP